jgi:hypothetical protein
MIIIAMIANTAKSILPNGAGIIGNTYLSNIHKHSQRINITIIKVTIKPKKPVSIYTSFLTIK